jgi:hypothetical protein
MAIMEHAYYGSFGYQVKDLIKNEKLLSAFDKLLLLQGARFKILLKADRYFCLKKNENLEICLF